MVSRRVGQVTLLNSTRTWRTNSPGETRGFGAGGAAFAFASIAIESVTHFITHARNTKIRLLPRLSGHQPVSASPNKPLEP
jgi:hypothetical protein